MEAEAIVDLLITDYPTVKFWVSLQCKVVIIYITFASNNNLEVASKIHSLTCKYLWVLSLFYTRFK